VSVLPEQASTVSKKCKKCHTPQRLSFMVQSLFC
jgi:hypothetical protein